MRTGGSLSWKRAVVVSGKHSLGHSRGAADASGYSSFLTELGSVERRLILLGGYDLNSPGGEHEGNLFIDFSETCPLEKNVGTWGDAKQEKTGVLLKDLQKNIGEAIF